MKITDKVATSGDLPLFICDYSPPRTAVSTALTPAANLDADYICVAYNPGRRVRVDSALFAYAIKQHSRRDTIFNLSPRDMNKLALQSHLLGLQLIGLENVVIVYGDPFTEKELAQVSNVRDWKPTELIQAIKQMNNGVDYKGGMLNQPTDYCIGATIDLSRGIAQEAALTHHKKMSGADFFISQPVFNTTDIQAFQETFASIAGHILAEPLFYGVQILEKDGVIFSSVPTEIRTQLEKGRDGVEIALEQVQTLLAMGITHFYLIPPIMRGGARKYEAAQQLITAVMS